MRLAGSVKKAAAKKPTRKAPAKTDEVQSDYALPDIDLLDPLPKEDAHKGDLADRKALMRFNRLLGMQGRQSSALIGLATRAAYQPIALHGPICGFQGQGRHQRQEAMGECR